MRWASLALAALWGASAPTPPAAPASADPELALILTSLAPSQRAAVEKEAGGLAALPRYRLDLSLDPEEKTLRGREQIALQLAEPARELWLRLPANAVPEGSPVAVARAVAGGREISLEPRDPGIFRVSLEPPLPAGPALLELELVAELPELSDVGGDAVTGMMGQAMAMLSRQEDHTADPGPFGYHGASYDLAGFFPELVRREAGVFDAAPEPGVGEPRWGPLAHYVVSLVTPAGLSVAGTGVELGSTPEKDGRKRTTRVAAAVRGFALVAGPGLVEQVQQVGEVKVRALCLPGHEGQAKKVLDTAARALQFFSDKLGPYPWAQLELVEAPLTGSTEALSFPTLVLFSGLLASPGALGAGLSPSGDPGALVDDVLELATAHHVAHQYWRGVVGSDGGGRPALDEPVTSYAAYLYVEQRRGGAQARRLIDEQMKRAYRLYRTLGYPDTAVDRPLSDYGGRLELEAILRGKGGLYYQRLRALLGDKAFFSALRSSVARHRFKEVGSDPVLIAAAGAAPEKAEAALKLHERWMRQLHGDEDIGAQLDFASLGGSLQMDPAAAKMLQQMLQAFGAMGAPRVVPPAQPKAPKSAPKGQGATHP